MYKEIIKLKETEKLLLEKKKQEHTATTNKISDIKEVYEKELKSLNSKETIESYMKDTMNVKLILSEMSQMSEQIKNNSLKIDYLNSLLIEKNIEIEKFKYLQEEIDEEKKVLLLKRENEEIQNIVLLKEIKRLKNL
jgi:hypothetical protein